MRKPPFLPGRCLQSVIWALTLASTLAAVCPQSAWAYTPESPEVKAMVASGLKFLEASTVPEGRDFNEAGVLWLMGITLVKCGKDESHPIVAAGVKRCQAALAGQAIGEGGAIGQYGNSLAVIFLCEVDPVKYKPEIIFFLDMLLKKQQPGGGWRYSESGLDDTSQTQYVVLALWTADHAGIEVPTERIEMVCNWLMRTQDTGGGFAYQPSDRGGRTSQLNPTHTITAAGLGSVYICGDLLGAAGARAETPDDNGGLPPSVKLVKDDKEKKKGKRKRTSKIDIGLLHRSESDGNAWFDKNYVVAPVMWPLYYCYAYERYASFREAAEEKNEPEPKWYNDGVEYIKKKQTAKGAWETDYNEQTSTCFAILFLIRSTKKSIAKAVLTEGALAGGRGLPADVTNVRMKGNQIIGASSAKSIDDLLDLLESPDDDKLAGVAEGSAQITLGADATVRAKQVERLRKVVAQENYQARIVAVKALAQARDLDNVPVLIYAVGDPDSRVAKEARDGLRLISRRFDLDLPDNSTPAQRASAQQSWKQWFLSIRPEAEFLD